MLFRPCTEIERDYPVSLHPLASRCINTAKGGGRIETDRERVAGIPNASECILAFIAIIVVLVFFFFYSLFFSMIDLPFRVFLLSVIDLY